MFKLMTLSRSFSRKIKSPAPKVSSLDEQLAQYDAMFGGTELDK
jgi:hypothetical protein